MTFDFRLPPFAHQLQELEAHSSSRARAIFWEQGTGKTKLMIDMMCDLARRGEIDGVVVVAPSGVDRNWLSDELPAHLWESAGYVETCVYKTKKATTKWHQQELARLLHHEGLSVLLVSYDAFMTEKGKDFVWKFLKRRKCLYILDESQNIKTPSAKRTKSIGLSGRYAPYRRILTGTPVSMGPFDIYSQMKFLDQEFWHVLGIHTFAEFKTAYGEFEKGYNYHLKQEYDVLTGYKNLEQLYDFIQPHVTRVLKADVLDLPPKLYSRRYYELNPEQRRAYETLRDQYYMEFDRGEVTADLAIVRMLRLQQVLCGYVPIDEEDPRDLHPLGKSNPRVDLTVEICEDLSHPAIIWSRFTRDIDLLCERLGDRAVRYDGRIDEDEAERNKLAFQAGEKQFFVANQQKGSTGLTLHVAKTVIYHANSFKLIERLQSEDRAHRAGMDDNPVNYIDILGEIDQSPTLDLRTIEALRAKFDVASQITGDQLREWL